MAALPIELPREQIEAVLRPPPHPKTLLVWVCPYAEIPAYE